MAFGSYKYSNIERQLSRERIDRLVSRVKVRTLDSGQESMIRDEIERRRRGDGKISLRQVDEVLRGLFNARKISREDWEGTMKVFGEYFEKS